jgi:dTDP-4-dehydrorhamnose reductase
MPLLWITGATGFLGRRLVAEAEALGVDVDTTRVDVRIADAVAAHVSNRPPEWVIHTAYRQQPEEEARRTNVQGSANVASAAGAVGARLVHLSTDVVFSGRKGSPYVEEDAPDPVTDYGRTKADAERGVAEAHPAALLVRTSLIVAGPGREPSKHELAALDPANTWFTNEIRSPVRVADLAAAVLELAAGDAAGPLHVAGADPLSRHELAALVAGREVAGALAPPTRPLDCTLDSSRAQAMIRTRLRGVRELYR